MNQDIPEIQKLSSDQKSIFFAMLDKDGSSTINLEEFLAFANVLLLGRLNSTCYDKSYCLYSSHVMDLTRLQI